MSAGPDCTAVRSVLWDDPERSTEFEVHLRTCADCRQFAARADWLDDLLGQHLLVSPPPSVLERSLRAVRAAQPVAAPRPARSWLSLPAYLLAGALLAIWGAQMTGWAAGLVGQGAELLSALWLVLASPAAWLLPAPEKLATTVATWLGLGVLAWALRGSATGSLTAAGRSAGD